MKINVGLGAQPTVIGTKDPQKLLRAALSRILAIVSAGTVTKTDSGQIHTYTGTSTDDVIAECRLVLDQLVERGILTKDQTSLTLEALMPNALASVKTKTYAVSLDTPHGKVQVLAAQQYQFGASKLFCYVVSLHGYKAAS